MLKSVKQKPSVLESIKSIKSYSELYNDDDNSDDEQQNLAKDFLLPRISIKQRKEDKYQQHMLPIDDGIYDGAINEKLEREGLGAHSVNNGEAFYSGSWKNDKAHGYGFQMKSYGSISYHGIFENGELKEGYGKEILPNGYEYEGKIKNGKYHGLGCLSIKIQGLGHLDSDRIKTNNLRLVAEWQKGKTTSVFLNEIEEIYQRQCANFCESLDLIISSNDETQENQREYFQNLIALFDDSHSNKNLLNKISKHSRLPKQLKLAATHLYILDDKYSILSQYTKINAVLSYNHYIKNNCQQGLKIYAKKLVWLEDDHRDKCLSCKDIFNESLNDLKSLTELHDLRNVLLLSPSAIDLIRQLVVYANLRLIHIPSQNQRDFIEYHTKLLKSIWTEYFEKFKSINQDHRLDREKYIFFKDCYSILLNLVFLNQFIVNINARKVNGNSSCINFSVEIGGRIIFDKVKNIDDNSLSVIVFDRCMTEEASGQKIFISESQLLHNKIDISEDKFNSNSIILLLGCIENLNQLQESPKFDSRYEKVSSNKKFGNRYAFVSIITKHPEMRNLSLDLNENTLIEIFFFNKATNHRSFDRNQLLIESVIHNAMSFVLNSFRPWKPLQIEKWSYYLNETINSGISIKELGDLLFIKVLKDLETVLVTMSKLNGSFDKFSKYLELTMRHCKNNFLKSQQLNYQIKMKEIQKVVEYFSNTFQCQNSYMDNLIEFEFNSLKEFVRSDNRINELTDHLLNFNLEYLNLSQRFDKELSKDKCEEFYNETQTILALIAEIFKMILSEEQLSRTETSTNFSYSSTTITDLQNAVSERNIGFLKHYIESGEDINKSDPKSKQTALYVAIERKDELLISYLLENGADINVKDINQETPIGYSEKYNINLNIISDQVREKRHQKVEKLNSQLYTLQQIVDFVVSLGSLDLSWYVETSRIRTGHHSDEIFEVKGDKGICKVSNIKNGIQYIRGGTPHYVLKTLISLLTIINDIKLRLGESHHIKIKLQGELLMAIGKSFNYFNDQIKYTSLHKFKDDWVKPFQGITETHESYETIRQKLEQIELFFLYNRKLKEIGIRRALELFAEKNVSFCNSDLFEKIFSEYETTFGTYLINVVNKTMKVEDIVEETKKRAESSNFKNENISHIIAGLAVILSLTASGAIEKTSENKYILKKDFEKDYLLQPHCIQVLGVLMILNDAHGSGDSLPSNHLAEVLTGQGKSWALALLAGYFSLQGYNVTVACYSSYLSRRDENDFKKHFESFKFTTNVSYYTFEQLCSNKLYSEDNRKDYRSIVSDILSNDELKLKYTGRVAENKSILLIDEVDVFFSKQMGMLYRPVALVHSKLIGSIQKEIWKSLLSGKTNKQVLDDRVKTLLNPKNMDSAILRLYELKILEKHIDKMITTGVDVYRDMKGANALRDKYKLRNDEIYVKDSEGKYVSHTFHGYENTFNYLKLVCEREKTDDFHNIYLNEKCFGYLLINCGVISYSELPNSYQGIFGVSGSLKDLTSGETSLLDHYNIRKRSYYPSFFGANKLKFNEVSDFKIIKNKNDWFRTIVVQTRKVLDEQRSVLIYFSSEELVDEFYKNYLGDLAVMPLFITQNKTFDGKEIKEYDDDDVNKLIKSQFAGHHRNVTLLTKEFGRGVDFQAEAKVNEKGGMHVIQTFFSMDIKEETQIKGRTARKDEPGSYELIIWLDQLEEFKISELKNIDLLPTYSELNQRRISITNLLYQDKLRDIEVYKKQHQETLKLLERVVSECNDSNRKAFIKEIDELNI